MRNIYTILIIKPERNLPIRRPECRWQTWAILKCALNNQSMSVWTGFNWLRTGSSFGALEERNKSSTSTKGGESFEQVSDCWLLKKDSAPFSYIDLLPFGPRV
jgi:hypothetical protein